jgi:hypothetical protein
MRPATCLSHGSCAHGALSLAKRPTTRPLSASIQARILSVHLDPHKNSAPIWLFIISSVVRKFSHVVGGFVVVHSLWSELLNLQRFASRQLRSELELELIQTHMTQTPMLRVEVGARVCAQVKNM